MRVLICGDRWWSDVEAIRRYIEGLPKDTVVIHGAARGADRIAGELAFDRFCRLSGPEKAKEQVKAYPAKWTLHGRAAGPIRNRLMLDEGQPDLVVYFHHNLLQSKGTLNMVHQARKAGVLAVDGMAPIQQGEPARARWRPDGGP